MYRRRRLRQSPVRHWQSLSIQGLSLVASWSMERSKRLTYLPEDRQRAVLGSARVMISSAGGFNRSPSTPPSCKRKLTSSRCTFTQKDKASRRSRNRHARQQNNWEFWKPVAQPMFASPPTADIGPALGDVRRVCRLMAGQDGHSLCLHLSSVAFGAHCGYQP